MSRDPGRRSIGTLVVLTCLSLTLAVPPAAAQSTYGAVVGVLTDASKAVLPGATVTLKEVQTNVLRTTTSGSDGNYEFLNLTQGRYQVCGGDERLRQALDGAVPRRRAPDRPHRRRAAGGRPWPKR